MKKIGSAILVLAMLAVVWGATAGCGGEKARQPSGAPIKAPPANAVVGELVLPTAETLTAVTEKHFVMNWMLLGPLVFKETDFGGDQQQAAIDRAFVPNEADLDGTQPAPAGAAWKAMRFAGAENVGQVDLDAVYGDIDHVCIYAVAWLDCPQAVADARLCTGSDDYLKVWVNGKLVHTYNKLRRAGAADQDVVSGIALGKGVNRVVVKCVDVVLGWNFYLRLTDSQGRPILVRPKP
jgi:hypothetical protein